MNYARILDSIVQEVIDFDPNGRFTADIAALFELVPDTVGANDTRNPDGSFTKYIPPYPPVIDPPPIVKPPISVLAFRSLFTDAEKVAIYTAAKSAVEVQIWLDDLMAASDVKVDDPHTIAGVQALETAGLIGAGRAAEILA